MSSRHSPIHLPACSSISSVFSYIISIDPRIKKLSNGSMIAYKFRVIVTLVQCSQGCQVLGQKQWPSFLACPVSQAYAKMGVLAEPRENRLTQKKNENKTEIHKMCALTCICKHLNLMGMGGNRVGWSGWNPS